MNSKIQNGLVTVSPWVARPALGRAERLEIYPMQKQPLGNKADRNKNLEHGLQLFGMPARCVAFFFALSSPDHASCMRCPVSMKANPIRGSCTSFLTASDLDDDGCPVCDFSACIYGAHLKKAHVR